MPNTVSRNRVIVVGAGVAGLTAGSYLARNGFHVRVLEANQKIGGCCGTTEIDGFTFNDGAQYLIYPRLLDLVFSQLGFDRTTILPLRRATTPAKTYLPGGMSISLGEDLDVRVENGDLDIPVARQQLARLVRTWTPVDDIFTDEELMLSPFSAWKLFSRAWMHLPKFGRSLQAELERSFSDAAFRSAVAAQLLFAGAPLDQLPAVSIIAFISGLREGLHLPEGGMGEIPRALLHTLQQHGGEVLLNARVKKILIHNGRAAGVQTSGHEFFEADFVISTANAMATYQHLVADSERLRPLVRKAEKTALSMSAFSVQLGVSNNLDTASHINHVVPMIDDLHRYIRPAHDLPEWGYYSVPTLIAPELAPGGHSILEYVPAIRQDETPEAWSEERATRLADASIEWLQSRLGLNVKVKRVRSPREFEQELNLYRGAIYGVSAAKGVTGLFSHKSPIPGLYLAGQTTYPGLGIPTAALSGIHASQLLMRESWK